MLCHDTGGGIHESVTFVHDHYSSEVGESPTGHAVAILGGLLLIVVSIALAMTVALLPVAVTLGLLGLFIFGAGVWGHIAGPLKLTDLMDTVIGLAGAAIGLTFTLAVTLLVVGFVATVLVLVFDLVRNAF